MRSCEETGKNIEQAIQNALLKLKAPREDVDIKILNEGGFLKKAKVLVSISEDCLEKYEKLDKLKQSLLEEEEVVVTESEEEKAEAFAENFLKKKIEKTNTSEKAEKPAKVEKSEKPAKIEATEEAVSEKPKRERKERSITGEEFIKGVCSAMEIDPTIEKTTEDRYEKYSITGEGLEALIGHHGECMLSLSYLMNVVCKTEEGKRVTLDIENYREKRAESLKGLAERIASKVAKSGRYYKLEPMDASERKVIHTALQSDDRVVTMSKGEEPNRYLIVFPKEYSDK